MVHSMQRCMKSRHLERIGRHLWVHLFIEPLQYSNRYNGQGLDPSSLYIYELFIVEWRGDNKYQLGKDFHVSKKTKTESNLSFTACRPSLSTSLVHLYTHIALDFMFLIWAIRICEYCLCVHAFLITLLLSTSCSCWCFQAIYFTTFRSGKSTIDKMYL